MRVPPDPSSGKLPVLEKIGYGLGDNASNIFFQFINIFLLYYYTDVFGLSPAAVGTLFLVTRLWDAIADPLMGALADRTNTRHGRYRPYLLWMALPFGVIGYLTFANPDLGPHGKLVYAYCTYIALMTVYTAINVPYSALMGVMTPSSAERTSLSTYRFVGAFTGTLLISLTVRPLVRILGAGDEARGFQLTMAMLSVIAFVFFLITFATTRERIKPENNEGHSIRRDIVYLFKNRPWVIMVIAAVCTLANVAVRGGVTTHFFKYYVGDDGQAVFWFLDRTSLVLTSGALAFIAGIFFTTMLGKRFGKRNALMALTLLNAASMMVFFFIPPHAYGTMLAVNAIGSLFAGPTPALVWAIYTDVADYGEWRFGRRSTGLAVSAAMFAQKLGLTIGGGLCGYLLGYYGFVANAPQTDEALFGIRLMFSFLPGLLALANGIVLIWYPLTEEMVSRIESDLARRRDDDSGEAPPRTARPVLTGYIVDEETMPWKGMSPPALPLCGEQPGIRHGLPERLLAAGLDRFAMAGDDAVEIESHDFIQRVPEGGAVGDAPFEDAAHPGVAVKAGDMAMEEAVPPAFIGGEVEDQIGDDERL